MQSQWSYPVNPAQGIEIEDPAPYLCHVSQRRADPVTVTSSAEHKGPAALASTMAPPVSGSYDRAASALREASSGLKLHLQAFDQAYTQLITAITQAREEDPPSQSIRRINTGQDACTMQS